MKSIIKQSVEINQLDNKELYSVCYITEYKNIFGKHKIKRESFDFLFTSFKVAENFCEVHPKVSKCVLVNCEDRILHDYYVKYHTYKLKIGKETAYIIWDEKYLIPQHQKSTIIYKPEKRIVNSFITNPELYSYTNNSYGVFKNLYRAGGLLSFVLDGKQQYNVTKTYKFDLVDL